MEMRREKEERNLAVVTDSSFNKMVLKLAIEDEKRKRKALKVVAVVEGVDSVAVDDEGKNDDCNWGSRPFVYCLKTHGIRF
ncbi:hypothetical protein SUGI_1016970 [Cryptomeria japonica]|nr:hypothetical protein SUGI_1016970 [Cryptomeria japonica]